MRLPFVLLAAGFAFVTNAAFAAEDLPWKHAVPGARGWLGDDGGDASTATVCDTVDRYRRWLAGQNTPAGCYKFPHGLAIVVRGLIDDPTPPNVTGLRLNLARITIPARHYTGVVQMLGTVLPDIPVGTVVHYDVTGEMMLQPNSESNGTDIRCGTVGTASVLKFFPGSEGLSLYVQVRDGPCAGRKGWTIPMNMESADGREVAQFDETFAR